MDYFRETRFPGLILRLIPKPLSMSDLALKSATDKRPIKVVHDLLMSAVVALDSGKVIPNRKLKA
jgi:hypothetical protein